MATNERLSVHSGYIYLSKRLADLLVYLKIYLYYTHFWSWNELLRLKTFTLKDQEMICKVLSIHIIYV